LEAILAQNDPISDIQRIFQLGKALLKSYEVPPAAQRGPEKPNPTPSAEIRLNRLLTSARQGLTAATGREEAAIERLKRSVDLFAEQFPADGQKLQRNGLLSAVGSVCWIIENFVLVQAEQEQEIGAVDAVKAMAHEVHALRQEVAQLRVMTTPIGGSPSPPPRKRAAKKGV
jgi:hypothetical protein